MKMVFPLTLHVQKKKNPTKIQPKPQTLPQLFKIIKEAFKII